jgi:hypothetical protein
MGIALQLIQAYGYAQRLGLTSLTTAGSLLLASDILQNHNDSKKQ